MPEVLQILYNINTLLLCVPTSLELKHCGLLSVQEIYVIFIDKLHNNNYQSFASVFCIMTKVMSSILASLCVATLINKFPLT